MAPKRKAAKGVEEAVAKVSRAAVSKRKGEGEGEVPPAKRSVDEQRKAAAKWAEEQFSPKKSPAPKEPVKKEPVKKDGIDEQRKAAAKWAEEQFSPKKSPAPKEPVKREPVRAKAPAKVEEEEDDDDEEEEEVRPAPKTKSQRQAIAASARDHVRETHENSSPARKEAASSARKEVSNKSTKVATSDNTFKNKTQLTESVPVYKLVVQIVLFLFALAAAGLLFIIYTNNSKALEVINKFVQLTVQDSGEVVVNSHSIKANIAYFSLFGFCALAMILATI